jgi:hypothetical protein
MVQRITGTTHAERVVEAEGLERDPLKRWATSDHAWSPKALQHTL